MPLEKPSAPTVQNCLSIVQSWLEQENFTEAIKSLNRIQEPDRSRAQVLRIELGIYQKAKRMNEALDVADELVSRWPAEPLHWIARADVEQLVAGIEAAIENLMPALQRFPEDDRIPNELVNLATDSGRNEEARLWLKLARQRAIALTSKSGRFKEDETAA